MFQYDGSLTYNGFPESKLTTLSSEGRVNTVGKLQISILASSKCNPIMITLSTGLSKYSSDFSLWLVRSLELVALLFNLWLLLDQARLFIFVKDSYF